MRGLRSTIGPNRSRCHSEVFSGKPPQASCRTNLRPRTQGLCFQFAPPFARPAAEPHAVSGRLIPESVGHLTSMPTFSAAKGPVVYSKGAWRYVRPRPPLTLPPIPMVVGGYSFAAEPVWASPARALPASLAQAAPRPAAANPPWPQGSRRSPASGRGSGSAPPLLKPRSCKSPRSSG